MKQRMIRLMGLLAIVLSSSLFGLAQVEDDVIINEAAVNPATQKEYVELLVTNPAGVNLQGWTLSDVSTRAGATGTTEGDITFSATAPYLANVPAGTYVVIVLTTPAANTNTLTEDLSTSDGNNRLVLIAGQSTDLILGGTLDLSTNENLHLYAGTRAAGTLIDQVLMGTNTSYIAGATWGDNDSSTLADNVNGGAAITSGSAVAFTPADMTLAELQNNDTGTRFTVTAASYGTPGLPNAPFTAGEMSVSGRATTTDGRGITNARITLSGGSLESPITVYTGRRGTFLIEDLEPGTYIISIGARRFSFEDPQRVLNLTDSATDILFVGTSRRGRTRSAGY